MRKKKSSMKVIWTNVTWIVTRAEYMTFTNTRTRG